MGIINRKFKELDSKINKWHIFNIEHRTHLPSEIRVAFIKGCFSLYLNPFQIVRRNMFIKVNPFIGNEKTTLRTIRKIS